MARRHPVRSGQERCSRDVTLARCCEEQDTNALLYSVRVAHVTVPANKELVHNNRVR